jgi:hypothetical protein
MSARVILLEKTVSGTGWSAGEIGILKKMGVTLVAWEKHTYYLGACETKRTIRTIIVEGRPLGERTFQSVLGHSNFIEQNLGTADNWWE